MPTAHLFASPHICTLTSKSVQAAILFMFGALCCNCVQWRSQTGAEGAVRPGRMLPRGAPKRARDKKKEKKEQTKKTKIKNEEKTMFTPLLHQTDM